MNPDRLLSSYDYDLPSELIAQNPVTPRDSSRLLVVKPNGEVNHSVFYNLKAFLSPGDLLVLNDTRVIPARLYGKKSTGAEVEVLLVEEKTHNCWLSLVKPGKRFTLGSKIYFGDRDKPLLTATVVDKDEATGGRFLQFELSDSDAFWPLLEQVGQIPFPPYVTDSQANPQQYQTIYAQNEGAIAAPTAGLHFTDDLFAKLKKVNINVAKVTLHVGIGTFRPVEMENITEHQMHQEWIEINQEAVSAIQATKEAGRNVIAVGTTVVRTLEGAYKAQQKLTSFEGKTDLFIYPGYEFKVVDGLITNFHLPKSSLLMLVSSLIGREKLMAIYQEAIKEKYRFYSFGDAMFIMPRHS